MVSDIYTEHDTQHQKARSLPTVIYLIITEMNKNIKRFRKRRIVCSKKTKDWMKRKTKKSKLDSDYNWRWQKRRRREGNVLILASRIPHRRKQTSTCCILSLARRYGTSSLETRACDPSGDNKVTGRWTDLFGPGSCLLFTDLPIPSRELGVRTWAKACGLDTLRAEEITGWCLPSPTLFNTIGVFYWANNHNPIFNVRNTLFYIYNDFSHLKSIIF